MNFEGIMLTEIGQRKMGTVMNSFICGISERKKQIKKKTLKTKKWKTQTHRKTEENVITEVGVGGGEGTAEIKIKGKNFQV